jgi:tetratricopeptide (TPR) repeat protein
MDRAESSGGRWAHACAIVLLAALPFAVAVGAPFTFDDTDYITGNPLLAHPELIISGAPPGGGSFSPNVAISVRTRALGHLSFALSYAMGGYSPVAFRMGNIALHAANGVLLYALVLSLLAAPRLRGAIGGTRPGAFALAIAALFALHPTAAESVTYISQRFTSQAAFFSLGSLLAYVRARHGGPGARNAALLALATALCLAAMLTKETAFTLPLIAASIEGTCFEGRARGRMLWLAPLLALMPLIPALRLDPSLPVGEALAGAARASEDMPRLAYLLTQPRVIMTYLRLSALPLNLTLDYDYPLAESPLAMGVVAPALGVALALALGLRGLGSRHPGARLAGLGVVWFLLALAVESSLVPLNDLAFEHRMYFPLAGIALAAGAWGAALAPRGRLAFVPVALVLALFGALAVERNLEWRDPRVLWRDAANKAPLKPRPWNSLGIAHLDRGGIDEAEAAFSLAVARAPRYAEAWNNLAIAHMLKGRPERAREVLGEALAIKPDYPDAHLHLGGAYEALGDTARAEAEYRRAAELKPSLVQAPMRLGLLMRGKGRRAEAETWLLRASGLAPRDAGAAYALGVLYAEMGRTGEAERAYRKALALDPGHADARVNLGSLYLAMGRPGSAEAEYRRAIMAQPGHALAHYNLGRILEGRRDWAGALLEYDQALGGDSGLDRAWNNRGVVLARLGRLEEAREAFGRALALAPGNGDYARNLGSTSASLRDR